MQRASRCRPNFLPCVFFQAVGLREKKMWAFACGTQADLNTRHDRLEHRALVHLPNPYRGDPQYDAWALQYNRRHSHWYPVTHLACQTSGSTALSHSHLFLSHPSLSSPAPPLPHIIRPRAAICTLLGSSWLYRHNSVPSVQIQHPMLQWPWCPAYKIEPAPLSKGVSEMFCEQFRAVRPSLISQRSPLWLCLALPLPELLAYTESSPHVVQQ